MRATWTAAVLTATLGLAPVITTSVTVANAADSASATSLRLLAAHPERVLPDLARPGLSLPELAGIIPPVPDLPVKPPAPDLPVKPPAPDLPVKPPVDVPALPDTPALPELPAVPDPGANLAILGSLGDVLGKITGLVGSATSGAPDPAALQKQLDGLKAAIEALLGKLPVPPVPATTPTLPVDQTRAVPSDLAPSLPPAPDLPATPAVPAVPSVPGTPSTPALPAAPLPLNPADALAKVQQDLTDLVAKATAAKPDPAAVKEAIPGLSTDTVAATAATATALATG
ncbi:hypothetical protein ACIRBX_10075 [Kitasatospora sp. NPDC096147]|uniref:hypothetical protein n=1 Tax=Kitasatospora sp. NPDC096147 TaxID=3364093 RepID=UPI00380969BE